MQLNDDHFDGVRDLTAGAQIKNIIKKKKKKNLVIKLQAIYTDRS